jgi:hypothetical protein
MGLVAGRRRRFAAEIERFGVKARSGPTLLRWREEAADDVDHDTLVQMGVKRGRSPNSTSAADGREGVPASRNATRFGA